MSTQVKTEFENPNTPTLNIGNINPIEFEEFIQAIKLIKIDKATSNDCTTDHIIRKIILAESNLENDDLLEFALQFLKYS